MVSRHLRAWLLALFLFVPAWAGGIQLDSAQGMEHEGHLALDARFRVSLNPVHENALLDGVPLTFVMEFTLTRPRWYWAMRRMSDWFSPSARTYYKLYYHPLTRSYRVEVGTLYRSFDTLGGALSSLGVARDWEVGQRGAVTRRLDSRFGGEIRMRLDKTQLPKPLQLSLLGDADWNLDSGNTLVEFEE
ncbi:MAG: DUF4390 domain-containing protein, partial [Burkholderiales bacterium]|nr:DUF4390 domain-containing protein [Burkholderiales bacterium]